MYKRQILAGDDGKYYYFAHGAERFSDGRVSAGQRVGSVGSSGTGPGGYAAQGGTDPHLHLAVGSTGDFNLGARGGNGDIDPDVLRQQVTLAVANGVAGAAPLVQKAFQYAIEAGLPDPELFAAQIQQESGYDPNAVSSAGARGIGQFMPGTAAMVAKQMGVSLEEFWSSTDLQLRGAAMHMADLTKQFGSQSRALSAYYSGSGGGVHPEYVNAVEGQRATVRGPARGAMAGGIGDFLNEMEVALAESFHIRPEIFEPMAAQVQAFTDLMSQDLPTGTVTVALEKMTAAMAPVENAVANATMSLPDLEKTLVEMGARAGLSNEPLDEMRAGLITSATALQEMVASMATADPRFAALLTNLDKTGASTATFALDVLNLLAALNQAPAAVALAPGPAVSAPPPALPGVAAPGAAPLAALPPAVIAAGTVTVQQTAAMAAGWAEVTRAIDETNINLTRYSNYLFVLTPERLVEQRGGWQDIAEAAKLATEQLQEYIEMLASLPGGGASLEGLPEAHDGAYVARGGAAVLERGERVLTANQQQGNSATYNFNFNGPAPDRGTARDYMTRARYEMERAGLA